MRISAQGALIGVEALTLAGTLAVGLRTGASASLLAALILLNLAGLLFTELGFRLRNNFLKVYAFTGFVWYLVRLPVLTWRPEVHYFIDWPTWILGVFTRDDLQAAAWVLFAYYVGTGVLVAVLGRAVTRPRPARDAAVESRLGAAEEALFNPLFLLYLALAAYTLVVNAVLGLGRDQTAGSRLLGIANLLLAGDMVVLLLWLIVLLNYRAFSRVMRVKTWVFVTAFAASGLASGSRGFMLKLVLIGAVFVLVGFRNFSIRLTLRRIAWGLAATGLLLGSVQVGQAYRTVYRNPDVELSLAALVETVRRPPLSGERLWQWLSFRLSRFDQFSLAVLQEDQRYGHAISTANAFKALANWLVPGTIFYDGAEPVLPSHRLLAVDYGGADLVALDPLHTDDYGLFALGVMNAGVRTGLLWVCFVLATWMLFVPQIGRLIPSAYGRLWHPVRYWLFLGSLLMPGLDVLLFSYLVLGAQLAMVLGFAWAVTSLRARRALGSGRVLRPSPG